MRFPTISVALFAVVAPFAVVVACGGGQPAPVAPPAPSTTVEPVATPSASDTGATPSASASAAEVPSVWSDSLTKEQMVAIMKTRVVPTMKPIFQEHDAKRYAEFGCKTCHGPDFKDPKDFLPKLHMKGETLVEFKAKPDISKFMAEKVAPNMAGALGLKPFDMATHEGFGCGGCHTIEKS